MKGPKCAAAAMLALLLSIGCTRSVSWLDQRDRSQPLMRKASRRQAEGDTDAAIRLYTQALNDDPKLARAHLDLALLLDDCRKDHIGAVCHYRRYLELRPDSEKRDMIESRMRRAGQVYAAKVLRTDQSAALELADLKSENQKLKRQVARFRASVAALEAAADKAARKPAEGSAAGGRGEPTEPAAGPGERTVLRTYRVQPGDSLSSIAAEIYGDAIQWQKIHEANRRTLGDSHNLKVGQILSIP